MSDRREASARSPGAANGRTPPGPGSDRERVLLLECRLEQMQAALATAREEADGVRTQLAEMAARETEHARRFCLVHEELAEARAEIAVLHRHLERSEALREELAGHLFEAGASEDTEELMRLRRRALAEDQRAAVSERTVARLRERIDALVSSRETLLTRIAEWQQLIREDGPEAADLSEFLAELRREILDLEHRSATSDAREARLRERLALAGIDPDAAEAETDVPAEEAHVPAGDGEPPSEVEGQEPLAVADGEEATDQDVPFGERDADEVGASVTAAETAVEPEEADDATAADHEEPAAETALADGADDAPDPAADEVDSAPTPAPARPTPARPRTEGLISELLDAHLPEIRADLLLRLGRTGDPGAVETVRPWIRSSEPSVRAAAYEALGRLLEREPDDLEPHVRAGLGDDDPRVRRRVVLAAATARGLDANALLDPLREDPDPQVRRLVRQVLRQAPGSGRSSEKQPSVRA